MRPRLLCAGEGCLSRHALALDHARDGTSLPDLLGLRVLDTSLAARVRKHLPRVRRQELVAHFPSGAFDDGPAVDLAVLADAAAAAFGLPELRGRSAETARARRAAVHAAGPDVPSELLSDSLGVGVRAVQSLRLARTGASSRSRTPVPDIASWSSSSRA